MAMQEGRKAVIARIQASTGLPATQTRNLLAHVLDAITEEAIARPMLILTGFGTFRHHVGKTFEHQGGLTGVRQRDNPKPQMRLRFQPSLPTRARMAAKPVPGQEGEA